MRSVLHFPVLTPKVAVGLEAIEKGPDEIETYEIVSQRCRARPGE